MWFAKTANGFRGWFHAIRGNGLVRTGLAAGDFTVTVVDDADTTSTTPTVSESSVLSGLYYFDIPSAFFSTNGTGDYGVSVVINTRSGPSTSPHVRTAFGKVLRINTQDIDDIPTSGVGDWTSGEKEQIRDALGVAGTKTTATGGQLQNKAEPGDEMDLVTDALDSGSLATTATNEIRDAILGTVLESNVLGLTLSQQINLIRKILNNRLELKNGGAGDSNWVLYDDDDASIAQTWDVTDKDGGDITLVASTPARRTRGS